MRRVLYRSMQFEVISRVRARRGTGEPGKGLLHASEFVFNENVLDVQDVAFSIAAVVSDDQNVRVARVEE